jgi:guanosine-3',5'-bis(diphosphate) 3'-pyrophosphohydrolase
LGHAAHRLDEQAYHKISHALAVAEEAHSGQVRDDGTPYFLHPLRVALSLAEELDVWDPDLLCAALLHDAVEDRKQLTSAHIDTEFGARVGHIVRVLTKPNNPTKAREEINRYYFSRLLRADEDCKLVKLADKLDNVRDAINSPDLAKRQRTAAEAKDFYLKELAPSLLDVSRRQIIQDLLNSAIEMLESQTAVA